MLLTKAGISFRKICLAAVLFNMSIEIIITFDNTDVQGRNKKSITLIVLDRQIPGIMVLLYG